jgi:hypothetical protein
MELGFAMRRLEIIAPFPSEDYSEATPLLVL